MPANTGVFVLRDTHTLVAMQPASFATEDDFQNLIASFPALLAGDQIDAAAPRRFLLVKREQGVADAEGAGARWSLDHLFLDQDGVPTLVEVKRASDTRLRREVVGQMLDYAANGVQHWPAELIRAEVEARCARDGLAIGDVLATLTGAPVEEDSYWARVAEHLRAGRVRMLFVADHIPPELRRVVEFLNQQMQPAEVLAVELRQYQGEGLRTLVPLVIGQTQDAARKKGGTSARSKRSWDEASFLADFTARNGAEVTARAEPLRRWMMRAGDRVFFGDGQVATFGPVFARAGKTLYPISLSADGRLSVQFQFLLGKPVFGEETMRRGLLERLNALGFALPEAVLSKRPSVGPEVWSGRVEALLEVMDWFVLQLEQGEGEPAAVALEDAGAA